MATLFKTGFPHDNPDNAPIVATDFPDYTVIVDGLGGSSALTYSTTQYLTNFFSAYADSTTGDKSMRAVFSPLVAEVYYRAYIYIEGLPSGVTRIGRVRSLSFDSIASLYMGADGKIFLGNASDATPLWTATSAYINQWIRVEWRVSSPFSGTGGDQRVRIYAGGALHAITTSWTEQSTIVATTTYPAGIEKVALGVVGATPVAVAKLYFEAVEVSDTDWIGGITLPPIAGFTVSASTGVAPAAITFTNTSTNATAYVWDFGDGTASSTATSPSHTFTTSGTYNVTLAAFDAALKQSVASAQIVVTQSGTGATSLSLTYDAGTLGATLSESPAVLNDGTAPATYVNTEVVKGALAAHIDARLGNRELAYALGSSQAKVFFRNYITVTQTPTRAPMVLATAYSSVDNAVIARVTVDEHGIWQLRKGDNESVGNIAATSSIASSHKIVHRIEWKVNCTAAVQELRVYVGSNAHGTVPDIVISGDIAAGKVVTEMRVGVEKTCAGRVTMDQTAIGIADWIGAVASPNAFTGAPIAGFTASALTIAAGNSVIFKNKSLGTPTSYVWNFGDGTGTGTNPAHTYAGGGAFPVTMTATNAFGTSLAAALAVTVLGLNRGLAVPKVYVGGVWKVTPNDQPFINARSSGTWQNDGLFRVFKNGQWSSNVSLGAGANSSGWGPGTASLGTWYGSSMGFPGTDQESYDWTLETFGALDITRSFEGGLPVGWTWSGTRPKARLGLGTTGKVSWYSFNFPISDRDILSGRVSNPTRKANVLANVRQFVDSFPTNVRIFFTTHHEPENDSDSWTAGEFKNLQSEIQAVVTAHRETRLTNKNWVKYIPILMGWTVDPRSGLSADAWHTNGVDAWGYDTYAQNTQVLAGQYAIDHGYRYAFAELGARENGTDLNMRNALLSMWIAWQNMSSHPKAAVYWNSLVADTGWEIYASYTGVPRIAPNTIAPPRPLLADLWRAICQTGVPPTTLWP